jgi:Carboxypeptidase regulatory-like domain/TonB-dependent Receptor Plug Domain/TonB dependent receptor
MTTYITRQTKGAYRLLAVAFFALTMSVLAHAQSTTGSIYGTVTDSTGAALPSAQVAVKNVQTGQTQTRSADGSGSYTFPTLVPGDYTVSAQVQGFQSETQQSIRLDANQNVHANFALKTGEVSQLVTVDANTTLVDTRESQIAQTIDQKRIEDLPSVNRNVYELLTITPGVTNYTADTQTGSRAGTQVSVNGMGQNDTAYYLDGGYDTNVWKFGGNQMPNPSALQEFRIITSNFDAEFGRSPGGVVSAITRSGTNQYHGLVYDYLRNNVFNAKNYFVAGSVTPLRQNQFGANFGGPMPFLRDKAFFFLSYEGLRVRTPTPVTPGSLVVPTALERAGDFSQSPVKPTLPAGIQCGTAAAPKICASALDPVAQNLLNFVPVGSSDASNYGHPAQQSANANIDDDQGLARLDYHLGEKHQISAMYFESRGTSNTPTVSGNQIVSYAGMQNYEGQYNASLSDTWTVSPNKVNTVRAFYSLNHYIIANIYGSDHLLASLGSQAAQGGNYNAQPYFKITGYWQMGTSNAGPNNLPSSTLGASDSFIWTVGKHELKFGGAFMWDRFTSTGGASSNGLFTFSARNTSENALVNFLLGQATTLTQNTGVFFRSHSQDPSFFGQDNWQVTRRLSLNLGVRWEYFPMYTGQNNTSTFVPGQQSTRFPTAPLGLVFAGDKGIPDGIQKTPWNTFSPRLGFAYDVFGDGRTSFRGAYGVFYAAIDQVAVSNNLVQQPYSRSVTVSNTPNLVTPFAPAADPFPYTADPSNAAFLSGANIFALQPGFKNVPSVQEFSLGVQQQYGVRWSSQINYVGNVGRHGDITIDEDSPVYNPTCTSATCNSTAQKNARRPFNQGQTAYTYATISDVVPYSNTSYHSLQATLTRQFDHHFSLSASYVWSKAMEQGAVTNSYDIHSSYGPAGINMPNKFTASYIYITPTVHHFGLLGKEGLSGWQVNGITTLRSGQPFTITSGVDTNFDGTNNDRPNQIGIPYLPGGRSRVATSLAYINKAAFVQIPTGTATGAGNVRYDSLLSPRAINTDLSAFKTFPIYREAGLQFRAEAFNVFNEVNMFGPNSTLNSPSFGTISSAAGARVLQFALRLNF